MPQHSLKGYLNDHAPVEDLSEHVEAARRVVHEAHAAYITLSKQLRLLRSRYARTNASRFECRNSATMASLAPMLALQPVQRHLDEELKQMQRDITRLEAQCQAAHAVVKTATHAARQLERAHKRH